MDYKRLIKGLLFMNLMKLNHKDFDFNQCVYRQKAMYAKDKRDGLSKEGSSRVAFFLATNFPMCFVLECNYNKGIRTNILFEESQRKTS
jgi:hypothetical protein